LSLSWKPKRPKNPLLHGVKSEEATIKKTQQ